MLTRRALAALAMMPVAAQAQTQPWPTRPVRHIIPFAPGAATDILSRLMAEQIGQAIGQPVVAENRTGANGAIAAELVARGPKDGMLLTGTFSTHASNPHIYPRTPYDPVADFQPITLIATVPQLLVAHPAAASAPRSISRPCCSNARRGCGSRSSTTRAASRRWCRICWRTG
jgi:tripartite-type tricarboxylate transporter receptor subunit TctC